jgi:hypothetical protein
MIKRKESPRDEYRLRLLLEIAWMERRCASKQLVGILVWRARLALPVLVIPMRGCVFFVFVVSLLVRAHCVLQLEPLSVARSDLKWASAGPYVVVCGGLYVCLLCLSD